MKNAFSPRLVVALLCCAALPAVFAADGESPYGKLDSSLVSPHLTFASPLSGGPVKVVVVAPGKVQRETVELAQRLSLDYTALMTDSFDKFGPWRENTSADYAGISNEEFRGKVGEALRKLDACEVVVIGKVAWAALPGDIKDRILAKVKAGGKLLYVTQARDKDSLRLAGLDRLAPLRLEGFPLDAIPALKGTKLSAGALGRGMVATLVYPEPKERLSLEWSAEALTPFESDDPLYYDYCHGLLAKIMLQLARPQRPAISNLETRNGASFNVRGEIPAGAQIAWEVRDRGNRLEHSGATVPAAPEVHLQLPELTGGDKMLNVFLEDKEKARLDFACAALKVVPEVQLEELALKKDGLRPAETLSGHVKLSKAFAGLLLVDLTDRQGRSLAAEQLPVSGDGVDFTLKPNHPTGIPATLTAKLAKPDGHVIDARDCPVYFDLSGQGDDFKFGIWANCQSNSRLNALALEQLRKSGVDVVMDTSIMWMSEAKRRFIPRAIAAAEMRYAPYATRLIGVYDKAPKGKYGPTTDAAAKGECQFSLYDRYKATGKLPDGAANVAEIAKGCAGIGTEYYNLGDENGLFIKSQEDICYCPSCQAAFRVYLRKNYPSLEALNQEWGTAFGDWGQVTGIPLAEAWKLGQSPRWVDYRLFMEEQFVNYHLLHRDAITSVNPDAKCGVEGLCVPDNSLSGFCLYKLLPNFKFFAPYASPREIHAMKYLPEGSFTGAWFGSYEGTMGRQRKQWEPWRYLFHGLNSALWWTAGGVFSNGSLSKAAAFRPDMTLLEHYDNSAAEIRRIKDSGVGKLLVNAKKRGDAIAVHYSNNALHASTLRPDESSWGQSHEDVHALLSSLGLEYEFLSPPELEAGVPERFKALFLPYSQALSAKEAERIKDFVRRGGVVFADFSPGIMDEHGKTLPASSLQEVFGKFEKLHVNAYGKGKAVCLGDYIAAFNAKWQQDESLGVQKGMLRLLGSLAGVKPLFKVANERGELYPCDVFEDGQTKYLCLLGPMSEKAGGAQAAGAEAQGFGGAKQDSSAIREVELQAPMCVYDILDSNRFLGKVQRFKVTMLPAVGRVLACLPAPVDGLELAPAAKEAAPGDAVEFSCRRLPANGWVALVKVFGPDKAELPWYGQRLYSRGPAMKIVVPTAFNDKPGTYTVEATEAVSGKTARARFTLARPNLLLNGDFEKGASSNLKSSDKYLLGLIKRGWNFGDGPFAELPPDWTPNVGAAKVKVVDAELAHSGSHALRLETSKQGCHLYAQGGKAGRYHVSFWARGQGVLTLCLYCWGKNGQEKTVALAPVKLDDAWRQFDQDFDVKALAADAASFTLAVSLGGNSTLFLDDLRLFENKE